jgi:hypothetical protein
MYWLIVGAIFVIGCILAFFGTLCVARDLQAVVGETVRSLPPEDLSHALDIVDDIE